VKAALSLTGLDVGSARPPAAWPLTPAADTKLRELLRGWGAERSAAAE
jgi:4-hydroxy-tetrahydrodipicolinate synthase